ncbi:hypothetical protein G7K_5849-t1 [Saitoella complicata NRRL Y-17804]|uniref:Uncharacterized protein n=1 Tax=Saitoella complicata (strain BCRC 22490 / CBS 7301 / JCM 7358 / NBRC 10748 / NRRL Y-17804) TaxID=698492 RepID=A0A0E9NPY1_SAICN|nr:hypothetical protein G7K_5849-t1 [Saitoella complicata NRRL Y-17804]
MLPNRSPSTYTHRAYSTWKPRYVPPMSSQTERRAPNAPPPPPPSTPDTDSDPLHKPTLSQLRTSLGWTNESERTAFIQTYRSHDPTLKTQKPLRWIPANTTNITSHLRSHLASHDPKRDKPLTMMLNQIAKTICHDPNWADPMTEWERRGYEEKKERALRARKWVRVGEKRPKVGERRKAQDDIYASLWGPGATSTTEESQSQSQTKPASASQESEPQIKAEQAAAVQKEVDDWMTTLIEIGSSPEHEQKQQNPVLPTPTFTQASGYGGHDDPASSSTHSRPPSRGLRRLEVMPPRWDEVKTKETTNTNTKREELDETWKDQDELPTPEEFDSNLLESELERAKEAMRRAGVRGGDETEAPAAKITSARRGTGRGMGRVGREEEGWRWGRVGDRVVAEARDYGLKEVMRMNADAAEVTLADEKSKLMADYAAVKKALKENVHADRTTTPDRSNGVPLSTNPNDDNSWLERFEHKRTKLKIEKLYERAVREEKHADRATRFKWSQEVNNVMRSTQPSYGVEIGHERDLRPAREEKFRTKFGGPELRPEWRVEEVDVGDGGRGNPDLRSRSSVPVRKRGSGEEWFRRDTVGTLGRAEASRSSRSVETAPPSRIPTKAARAPMPPTFSKATPIQVDTDTIRWLETEWDIPDDKPPQQPKDSGPAADIEARFKDMTLAVDMLRERAAFIPAREAERKRTEALRRPRDEHRIMRDT